MMRKKLEIVNQMLRVIGEGLQGRPIAGLSTEEVLLIIEEGRRYGIDVLLYYLLKKDGTLTATNRPYRNLLISNFSTQQNLGKFLQQMERDGIHAVVLKGYSLAMRYPDPACRMSCDADILIDRNEEKSVFAYLRRNGFQLKGKRPRTGCDSQWYREDVGTIELHIALFNPLNARCLFSPVINEIQLYGEARNTNIGSVWMLSDLDNLLYTFLHLAKHYLIGNMTIQMIVDFWLLYKECENAGEYLSKCAEQLGLDDLLKALICFAEKYFSADTALLDGIMNQTTELIYNYLFEGSGKNIYEKHLRHRIVRAERIDIVGIYLFCCWKTRIGVQCVENCLQKLRKRIKG